ncbi:hypothetical protein PRUPE_6G079200 [Prunus persica]|uniref:Uncharacterized protein n=1 Tax=Prunus persica TaxID=3760 RepID=A0A251NLV9_PRUPE|nr:hypothetical protein PRUPE_6G079200 [Prunus persica]
MVQKEASSSPCFSSGFRFLQHSLYLGLLRLCYQTSCATTKRRRFQRILTSDPGIVTNGSASSDQPLNSSVSQVDNHDEELELPCHESTEGSGLGTRVRYCRTCKAYIKGLDHHCPAFGNCIVAAKSGILDRPSMEPTLSENLAVSTILFMILQLVWQVVFVIWHIYCVCVNIRTDEWIKWKKYPEFQLLVQPQPGQSFANIRFRNPYDKGILQNVEEFLALRA